MEAAITFMVVITPICTSPSGKYILIGVSVKRQLVGKFSTRLPFSVRSLFRVFQTYTNDICWVCKCHSGGAANWPGEMENLTRFWEGWFFTGWRKKICWVCYRGVCCFILVVRFHILPKVSCRNDQSSIKFKSKLVVSFANGSGTYKLLECKGDSSVACTFNRFIFSLLLLLFLAACYKLY